MVETSIDSDEQKRIDVLLVGILHSWRKNDELMCIPRISPASLVPLEPSHFGKSKPLWNGGITKSK